MQIISTPTLGDLMEHAHYGCAIVVGVIWGDKFKFYCPAIERQVVAALGALRRASPPVPAPS
jgi:hypothetical protein